MDIEITVDRKKRIADVTIRGNQARVVVTVPADVVVKGVDIDQLLSETSEKHTIEAGILHAAAQACHTSYDVVMLGGDVKAIEEEALSAKKQIDELAAARRRCRPKSNL